MKKHSLTKISIIMAVYNGSQTLDRAIASVLSQNSSNWELIAIDDCSDDNSWDILLSYAVNTPNIKLFRNQQNIGTSASRNIALKMAEGEFVAYLDSDDEFYYNYIELLNKFIEKYDVLITGYDISCDFAPRMPLQFWDPSIYKDILFAGNLSTPLGISHRLDLVQRIGGFNELLYGLEDWELLKRMARAGADFIFLSFRSGIYHILKSSRSRNPRLTERQRMILESNRRSGISIYGEQSTSPVGKSIKKILFITPLFFFEPANIRFHDLREAVKLLKSNGYHCQGFCPSKLTECGDLDFEDYINDLKIKYSNINVELRGNFLCATICEKDNTIVTVFCTRSSNPAEYIGEEGESLRNFYEVLLSDFRPDAIITGNSGAKHDEQFDLLFHIGKCIDIPIVVWLTDISTINPFIIQNADYFVVTSESLSQQYWEDIGLVCRVLPPVFDWDRMCIPARRPSVLALPFSDLPGESFFLASITGLLRRLRPDIPVASGRIDIDFSTAKLLVAPSFGLSHFNRTVASAMINGVPVLASNRGALPEIVDEGGIVIDIPSRYKVDFSSMPDECDVNSWVNAIIELWDNPVYYSQVSEAALSLAMRWHPSRVNSIYENFFRNLTPQPGPSLIPKKRLGSFNADFHGRKNNQSSGDCQGQQ